MEIDLTAIIFQLINFGIILGVLWFLLYKPVLKIFAERAKRVEEGQRAAAKAIAEQEKIASLKEETEKELREKTNAILKQATEEAKQQQEQILEEARQKAAILIEKMQAQREEEWQAAIHSQEQAMVESIYAICAKVLPEGISAKDQSALIDKEIVALLKQL